MSDKTIIKQNEIKVIKSPLGRLNKRLLFIYSKSYLKPIQIFVKMLLHLELPSDVWKKKVRLGHPFNIIINSKTNLGGNVTIYHNVTIGSKQFGHKSGVPTIEENVIIYPHSCILGKITIGKNAIIGAGSVVMNDVKPFSIVAGNPAKQVGTIEEKL